jgi:hypothetical protein
LSAIRGASDVDKDDDKYVDSGWSRDRWQMEQAHRGRDPRSPTAGSFDGSGLDDQAWEVIE